jgi:hypothetical protein
LQSLREAPSMNSPKPESAADAAAAAPAMPRSDNGRASVPMDPAPIEGVAPEPKAGPEAFLAFGVEEEAELLSRGAEDSAPWKTFFGAPFARTTLASAAGEEARRRAEAARAAASCLTEEAAVGGAVG